MSRRNSWQTKIDTLLAQGRRQSAAGIIQRLRSGSLTSWNGGPLFANPFKSAHFAPGEGDGPEGQTPQPFRIQQRLRRMSIVDPSIWKKHGNASLGSVLSALYAKLLVVMGMAFPMSEVISTYVPPAYYDGFYLYLYFVSILFMAWLFSHVIKQKAKEEITKGVNTLKSRLHNSTNKSLTDGSTAEKSDDENDTDDHEVRRSSDHHLRRSEYKDDDIHSQETAKLASSSESNTESKGVNDTHSEDSDDKLSPLPTDDKAGSPLLLRRLSPMPVPALGSNGSTTSHNVPTITVHSCPTLQSPTNDQHHHVKISSPPGHDGLQPSQSPKRSRQHRHHHHNQHNQQRHQNQIPPAAATQIHQILKHPKKSSTSSTAHSSNGSSKGNISRSQSVESSKYDPSSGQRSHFGSFYLRMGAVAFGIGSMIYSCLEFGQFLEQEPDTKCHSYMQAITPVVRIVFTFMQMYFIFLNSRMSVAKVSWIKQFGLMHLIGTNLCVWLNVLVQETKHEILHFYDPQNHTITVGYGLTHYGKKPLIDEHAKVVAAATSTSFASALTADDPHHGEVVASSSEEDPDMLVAILNGTIAAFSEDGDVINRLKRGLKGPHTIYECGRGNIMGSLVNSASPFLFPCTIEYSLICAAICYVMWKSMAKRRVRNITLKRTMTADSTLNHQEARNVHHYTVDCAGSNKGLFIGIFFLVFTIMSLILNFVLMKHHEHLEFAFWEVNLTEVILYAVSTLAVLIGMCQMRQLRYESGKTLELDNILLIVAQSGSLMFNVFCIVGGQLTPLESSPMILVTPLLCLIQLLLQTLFILDAYKRVVNTPLLARKKPGREIVTFLLVTNLAMWLVNALEKSRGDSHPHLLRFYGVWAWTIITDIAMPLAIFYRFHSTVCLCEIWKKAYKTKHKIDHRDNLMNV